MWKLCKTKVILIVSFFVCLKKVFSCIILQRVKIETASVIFVHKFLQRDQTERKTKFKRD